MSLSGYCYPVPGKAKAQAVCAAFSAGSGFGIAGLDRLREGAAFFYGVRPATAHLWEASKDWLYADNAYFDRARERYFRVTRNRIQHTGLGQSDGKRLKALGVTVQPWRSGRSILVCSQSEEFMRVVAKDEGWLARTVDRLQSLTDRPLVIRGKHDRQPLRDALRDAHAVVTWSSAAAVEALLAGVPVACSEQCAAHPLATPLDAIETPWKPERAAWAAVLADNQWSLSEMRDGTCWRALNP